MAKARVTLDQWIREKLADPDKEKPLSMLSLVHMVGMQQLEIHSAKIGVGGAAPDPAKMAQMFRGKAEVHAQDLPNVQTYNVLAFWGSTEPQDRYVVLVNNNTDLSASGLSTESPTEMGKTQQGMRWFETGMQQVFRRQQVLDDYSIRLLQHAEARLTAQSVEIQDAREIVFQVMKDKIMNDQEFAMKKLAFERSTSERKKWLGFAPALINNLLGREVFPESSEDTALIETIADNIKPEDIAKLADVVPPELAGPLMGRFIRHQKKREEESKAAEMATKTLPMGNPEDDAAGH